MLDQAAGRVEAARSNFFAALAIARDARNRRQEGVVLGYLGALESEKGQLDGARLYYDQALAIHRAVGRCKPQCTPVPVYSAFSLHGPRAELSFPSARGKLSGADSRYGDS